MFFICKQNCKDINYFGVKDTDDGVVEFYNIQELQNIINMGIVIDGLILDDNGKIINVIKSKVPSFKSFCVNNDDFIYLLSEWDYNKNVVQPYEISKSDNRLIWWKCSNGHEWQSSVHNRTRKIIGRKNFCHICFNIERNRNTSFSEQSLYFYLSKFIKTILHYKVADREFDIYLPDYNILIEYDSSIHLDNKVHKNDLYKNLIAEKYGYILIRISEVDYFYDNCYCIKVCDYSLDSIIKLILVNLDISVNDNEINSTRDRYKILSTFKARCVTDSSNLLVSHPNVVKYWDYNSNSPLKPEDFPKESREVVWWVCEFCKESFKAPIHHIFDKSEDFIRVHNKCKMLQYNKIKKIKKGAEPYYFSEMCPELVQYWSDKNKYKPDELSYKSRLDILFNCSVCKKEFTRILSGVSKSKLCKCDLCKSKGL